MKKNKMELVPANTNNSLTTIFSSEVVDEKKVVRRNLPPLVKPNDVPVGSVVSGEIVKVVNSQVSTVKGKLLWLRHESGTEFLFPVTGTIRSALVPGIGTDDGPQLQAELEKEIGNTFIAKRLENKMSDKYKKSMFMFDVFTSSK